MSAINKESKTFLSLLTITICVSYLFLSIIYKENTDDHFFSTALDKYGLFEILKVRYETWSGRVLIEAFLMTTINIKIFPQILIISSCLLLAYSTSKLASGRSGVSATLLAITLVLILSDFHSNRQATLWITGAYNYIVPISIGLYAISIYLDPGISTFKKTSSCLLIFISCNNEQFAVTALIGILASLLAKAKEHKLSVYDAFFMTSLFCGGAIVLSAPGNIIRMHSEILNWMPDFENYGVIHKLSVGVDRISNQINFNDNFLFLICCTIALVYLLVKDGFCIVRTAIMTVLSIKILTFLFSFYPDSLLSRSVRFDSYITPETWSNPYIYITYFINLVALSSILMTCLIASQTNKEAVKITVIMICGVISALMIGFSPTAYASGTRVMFIFDLSIVMASVFIGIKLYKKMLAISCGAGQNSLAR